MVNRGQNGNLSRQTGSLAMAPPRLQLQILAFMDMVMGCPLACLMMNFEISLFLLDLSSGTQEYLQLEFLSCSAFDKISSLLEVADSVASLRILF